MRAAPRAQPDAGTSAAPADRKRPAWFRSRPSAVDDEQLVERVRSGEHAAFEAIYERYGSGILGFCRHMLGSPEEAEDAVQHSFAAAYKALREGEREIALKPWLYTIARNRCLSLLRARRETVPVVEQELPTAGLDEQVQRRAELRELLHDIRELPEQQRAALLLTEVGAMSHEEVAAVLGRDSGSVKGLVFRARSGLIHRRDAREAPCAEIREQLVAVGGSSLRRRQVRDHLRSCEACRDFAEQLERQRGMLAIALPVAASPALHSKVLAATGAGGAAGGGSAGGAAAGGGASAGGAAEAGMVGTGAAAGSTAAGGAGGGALVGGAAALGGASAAAGAGALGAAPAAASTFGVGLIAKVLVAATLVGGGLAVTRAAVHHDGGARPSSSEESRSARGDTSRAAGSAQRTAGDAARPGASSGQSSRPGATVERRTEAGGAAAEGGDGAVTRALGEVGKGVTSGAAPRLPSVSPSLPASRRSCRACLRACRPRSRACPPRFRVCRVGAGRPRGRRRGAEG